MGLKAVWDKRDGEGDEEKLGKQWEWDGDGGRIRCEEGKWEGRGTDAKRNGSF